MEDGNTATEAPQLAYDDFGQVVRGRMFQDCVVAPRTDGDGWRRSANCRAHRATG